MLNLDTQKGLTTTVNNQISTSKQGGFGFFCQQFMGCQMHHARWRASYSSKTDYLSSY